MRNRVLGTTAAVALAGSLFSGAASAQSSMGVSVSGNVGVFSNYVWRGFTQNADEAAVQGGADASHETGLYIGAWMSNLEGGDYEADLYGGWAGEFAGVGVDVGLIRYFFPASEDSDAAEVYAGLSYGPFSVTAYYNFWVAGVDEDETALYVEGSASHEVVPSVTASLTVGGWTGDDDTNAIVNGDGDDYAWAGVSIAKATDYGDLSLATTKNFSGIEGDDEFRFIVGWSTGFDLL